jgi:hypothetical protein
MVTANICVLIKLAQKPEPKIPMAAKEAIPRYPQIFF